MKKFSKILESNNNIITSIEEIFINLLDYDDSVINISEFQGYYNFNISIKSERNYMEFIKDLSVIDERLLDLDLHYVSMPEIKLAKGGGNIKIRYKLSKDFTNKNVSGYTEFKNYCSKVLGIYGIERGNEDLETESDSNFRINVIGSYDPSINGEYDGWEIEHFAENVEDFVKNYPGYEDFLRKLCKRKLNWSAHHGEKTSTEKYPMKFDKEGIEAVEKLLEMAKKFKDINVIKT